jgi:hypothetical protein
MTASPKDPVDEVRAIESDAAGKSETGSIDANLAESASMATQKDTKHDETANSPQPTDTAQTGVAPSVAQDVAATQGELELPQLTDGLDALESVLRTVLGAGFEDEIRGQTEREKWYRNTLPVGELFHLWVRAQILGGNDAGWVFSGLRMADRRRLFEVLKIDPHYIATTTTAEHAERVLLAVGLPVKRTRGHRRLREDWDEFASLAESGEDERAATLGRQRAERFLRKMMYFYCATGHAKTFAEIVKDPGNLRLAPAFRRATETDLAGLFTNDDVTDLGFLTLALRKFSSRIEDTGIRGMSGAPLVLFGHAELEAFNALATALQPYTHDKPSKFTVRQQELVATARAVGAIVTAMAARNVVPDDVFVLETCDTPVGRMFRGVTDDGVHVHLIAQRPPPPGRSVLYLATAACQYASCVWATNPWTH